MKKNSYNSKSKLRWVTYLLILIVLVSVVFIALDNLDKNSGNSLFRDLTVQHVRGVAKAFFNNRTLSTSRILKKEGDWSVDITIYQGGQKKGKGRGKSAVLSSALEEATLISLSQGLKKEELDQARLQISFFSPLKYSFIEYEGRGLELDGNLVAIRYLDKEILKRSIEKGKEYLFRMVDPNYQGAHKYFFSKTAGFEDRLHTVYTSSLVYTLLKIYDFTPDKEIWSFVEKCTEFILSMQNLDSTDKRYGAFHYSFFTDRQEKEQRFVVGTTSKTIFTLLELYRLTSEKKFLDSAVLGADWLLTMQREDGSAKSGVRQRKGKWYSAKKESLLYNGQVLSALSRIHRVTGKDQYFRAAERIARRFTQKIETKGCYLDDDYRVKNPISSSWVVLALFDFYLASDDNKYLDLVLKCSSELLTRQNNDPNDIHNYGRWQGTSYTSGSGWLAEVMMEIYSYCRENKLEHCGKYKDAIVKVIRWLIQNTYTPKNSHLLEDPQRAEGGLIRNYDFGYLEVRTDSVCHGLNAYIGMMPYLEDVPLLNLPESPIKEFQ